MNESRTLIVCYDSSEGEIPVLAIAEKVGDCTYIRNSFTDDEAVQLFKTLLGK